ncbi:MAG: methyltransferase domain-containing protein [Boseongicola sp. SB0676_bin_33]|nr:methyltransferase domain-containing protein [Boseongicola sp. SB0676_bin_33]
MTTDRETLDVYGRMAGNYAAMVHRERNDLHLEAFIKSLPARARVLDLGCGPGRAAARMARSGLQVDAWDASPEMAAIARERFGLEVRVAAFDALDADAVYDGIYANFSLLHAPRSEMPGHLDRVAKALTAHGLFHIGIKTGVGERRDSLGRFYEYYEESELAGLLETAGFETLSRATGAEAGLDGVEAPWIVMQARKVD